jgi:hypothetical protein
VPPGGSSPRRAACFSDIDGHRFQAFITDQPDPDITTVELRHRQRARVEQRIRGAKATGLGNLPFDRFRRNAVWVELVLLALDLVAWAQVLLLSGELAVAQPKALRYRLGAGGRPGGPPRPPPGRAPATAAGRGRPSCRQRSPACARCRCAADRRTAPLLESPGGSGWAGMPWLCGQVSRRAPATC